ncbi:NusG domain II-containing protein, partial [Dysosmobacter welbionis]
KRSQLWALFSYSKQGGLQHETQHLTAPHRGWRDPDESAAAPAGLRGKRAALQRSAHPGRLPKGGEVLAGIVAGSDRSQGRTGLGDEHPAGHHPLSLPGGLCPPHPKPAVRDHGGGSAQRPLLHGVRSYRAGTGGAD